MRPDKIQYYLNLAETVSARSTCIRTQCGAIIVNNDEVVATGYSGSPRGCVNCTDINECPRDLIGPLFDNSHNFCIAVHAEVNAMLSASRQEMLGASLFIVSKRFRPRADDPTIYGDPTPCLVCHRYLINVGITHIYGRFDINGEIVDKEIKMTAGDCMERFRVQYDKVLPRLPYQDSVTIVKMLEKFKVSDDARSSTDED